MKARCAECYDWIAWSQREGGWYHLRTGIPECRWQDTMATRSTWLPFVPLVDDDRKLVRP